MTEDKTIEELEELAAETMAKLRHQKREKAWINLIAEVEANNHKERLTMDDISDIIKACHGFISQHRAMIKNTRFKPLDKAQKGMKTK